MQAAGHNPMICERVTEILDAYSSSSSELLVETCAEVNRHLACCPACTAARETRQRVKWALQRAVSRVAAPVALRERVRRQIRRAGN